MDIRNKDIAAQEKEVSFLYQKEEVAKAYIENRSNFSWQRLLHKVQVREINRIIQEYQPKRVLEVAPGPARLTVDVKGVRKGFLVEYSEHMIKLAKNRLSQKDLDHVWEIIKGNAFELDHIQGIPNAFDFIYTLRFIRHFREKDRVRLYDQIHAKLRRHGLFMLDVVNKLVREKIDSKADPPPANALPVYDVTYTPHEFKREMRENGFEVLTLISVIKHFSFQSWLSYRFDDVALGFMAKLIEFIEKIPSKNPLEWIALCQAI